MTITAYGKRIEPGVPKLDKVIDGFAFIYDLMG